MPHPYHQEERTMYTAKDYANRADYWRSHKLGRPFQQRIIRGTQDEAARLAGYREPMDPAADIYRRLLQGVTQWAHELGLDKAQQRTKDLAEFSADCADVYRMSGNRKAMRNFTRATAMYAEIYQTISDPDYWIEH